MTRFTAQQVVNVILNRRLATVVANNFIARLVEDPPAHKALRQLSSGRPSLRTGNIIKFKGGPE